MFWQKIQSTTALDEEIFDIYTEINGCKNENNVSDEMFHGLKFSTVWIVSH